ncbi:hypothetical protein [Nocardia neocaledoniensis]|uniref:hypothetical protein n=1 Tax=Nocardia neocaledoniensis TaxID=236511 RepID=UPI0024582420|nr:hypothetical protein [Nocardia neocaledoniensis]
MNDELDDERTPAVSGSGDPGAGGGRAAGPFGPGSGVDAAAGRAASFATGVMRGLTAPGLITVRGADDPPREGERCLPSGTGARAARRLAEIAAVRLADAPAAAEEQLRRALVVGYGELEVREEAELRTRLVTAIAAQPDRDPELARAAESAAACWQPISAADAAHLGVVAGRAWHRAGRHADAVAAFEVPLVRGAVGYPPGELARVRAEFAESLIRLGRYRQAAWQFTEAARLLAGDRSHRRRHADLVWSAAVARECCGQESAALGGYLRAAGLWGEQDKIVPRARCLRAAAWLQLRGPGGRVRGPWWVTMDVLLTELNQRLAAEPAAHIADELDRTRAQFAQMCAQASRTRSGPLEGRQPR